MCPQSYIAHGSESVSACACVVTKTSSGVREQRVLIVYCVSYYFVLCLHLCQTNHLSRPVASSVQNKKTVPSFAVCSSTVNGKKTETGIHDGPHMRCLYVNWLSWYDDIGLNWGEWWVGLVGPPVGLGRKRCRWCVLGYPNKTQPPEFPFVCPTAVDFAAVETEECARTHTSYVLEGCHGRKIASSILRDQPS